MAKWTGSIPTPAAIGCRIEQTMMMEWIASWKQPTTRNTAAMKKPVMTGPTPQAETPERIASGIL